MPKQGGGETVTVEGLDALTRAFGRVDSGLRRQMQKQLRVVGKIVAVAAKEEAAAKGLHQSGQLIARINPSLRGGSVFVRDTARKVSAKYPGGYSYPARYEYESGGARAFMRPALTRERSAVISELDRVVEWVAMEWGRS